jgi:rare lipoprotein A
VTLLPPPRAVYACPAGVQAPAARGTDTVFFGAALAAALLITVLFTGCSSQSTRDTGDYAPAEPIDISTIQDAVPATNRSAATWRSPMSLTVIATTLTSRNGHVERGIASWYGTKFHGQRTSSGEVYDLYKMTAAHKTLPLPTYAEVVNQSPERPFHHRQDQ